jgi:hypothetical protein
MKFHLPSPNTFTLWSLHIPFEFHYPNSKSMMLSPYSNHLTKKKIGSMCSIVLVCMFILGTSDKGPKSKSKVSSLGQIRWFNY